jgi:hypothetical protein
MMRVDNQVTDNQVTDRTYPIPAQQQLHTSG